MNRLILSIFSFFMFLILLGTSSLLSQQIYKISTRVDWDRFVANVNTNGGLDPATGQPNTYILEDDVGVAGSGILTTPITVPLGTFRGYFQGNDKKITVNINSNDINVGLFRVIDGGGIRQLIVDGYVIGGASSQNVGGLVGLVSTYTTSDFFGCENFANVTGISCNSSVGGIVGSMTAGTFTGFTMCVNNGTITGGRYVAGIVGSVLASVGVIRDCMNGGVIQSNNNIDCFSPEQPSYMAGIVAYVNSVNHLHCNTNIGRILSLVSGYDYCYDYVGGIAGYVDTSGSGGISGMGVEYNSNSGIVSGSTIASGGIVGYLGSGRIHHCLNTGWIEPLGVYNGAIVGFNNGTLALDSCYFDNQMCVVNGIGLGIAVGLPTDSIIGFNLRGRLVGNWIFQNNLYPSPNSNGRHNHPINLLAAAPIYLPADPSGMPQNISNVTTDFYVSNGYLYIPPTPNPYNHPYQWGWFNPNYNPFSFNSFIEITPPNNAIIRRPGGGQDSLSVRLINEPLYEKVIPIWLR